MLSGVGDSRDGLDARGPRVNLNSRMAAVKGCIAVMIARSFALRQKRAVSGLDGVLIAGIDLDGAVRERNVVNAGIIIDIDRYRCARDQRLSVAARNIHACDAGGIARPEATDAGDHLGQIVRHIVAIPRQCHIKLVVRLAEALIFHAAPMGKCVIFTVQRSPISGKRPGVIHLSRGCRDGCGVISRRQSLRLAGHRGLVPGMIIGRKNLIFIQCDGVGVFANLRAGAFHDPVVKGIALGSSGLQFVGVCGRLLHGNRVALRFRPVAGFHCGGIRGDRKNGFDFPFICVFPCIHGGVYIDYKFSVLGYADSSIIFKLLFTRSRIGRSVYDPACNKLFFVRSNRKNCLFVWITRPCNRRVGSYRYSFPCPLPYIIIIYRFHDAHSFWISRTIQRYCDCIVSRQRNGREQPQQHDQNEKE